MTHNFFFKKMTLLLRLFCSWYQFLLFSYFVEKGKTKVWHEARFVRSTPVPNQFDRRRRIAHPAQGATSISPLRNTQVPPFPFGHQAVERQLQGKGFPAFEIQQDAAKRCFEHVHRQFRNRRSPLPWQVCPTASPGRRPPTEPSQMWRPAQAKRRSTPWRSLRSSKTARR